jgi:membrane protein DedA with SNARE-associated domain
MIFQWVQFAVDWLVYTIGELGYLGIMTLMFLESTFVPIPSEMVVPPAGYLVSQGKMEMWLVITCSIIGSLLGALFNYSLAVWLGRPLLLKYGRYLLLPPHRFEKMSSTFNTHGEISTFTGRLIPGVRHFISFPAGLARMSLFRFCLYTTFGAGLWVVVLAYIGYFVGNNMELVKRYSLHATLVVAVFITILILAYIRYQKKKIISQG